MSAPCKNSALSRTAQEILRGGGEKGNGSSVPQYQPFQLGVGKEKQGRFIICWRFSK